MITSSYLSAVYKLIIFVLLFRHAITTSNRLYSKSISKSVKKNKYDKLHHQNSIVANKQRHLEMNVSHLLDQLIASHDRRIRPNYGREPIEVNITMHVTTISAISEVSMDYTVAFYLRQFWRDNRLAFESAEERELTIGIDLIKSIWVPDTFFPNEKKSFFHEATTHNSFLRIDNRGNVFRSIRLTVTAHCPMNLHSFPLDIQVCALEIESYGYSTRDIIYHWHLGENSVTIDENVHLAHFTIGDHRHVERVISLSTGNYSRLSTYFTFKRNIGFYLIQIYFPSSLVVVISWISFWLNRDATQARVAIGVTTVLTMTTLMTSTNATLPKVSYIKSLDIFLGTCYFIVFASLLEYATIGYLIERYRSSLINDKATAINYSCQLTENSPNKRINRAVKFRNHFDNESENDFKVPLLARMSKNQFHMRSTVIKTSTNECRLDTCMKIRPSQVHNLM
ncbi:Cation transporter family protein [Onchocerca flexuosa]|uniref:Gamma-aminobutyric acid receptor subunit beta n=1 Tax=Onchocerca flexuosa TaxID=387005 RepID=A0A238BR92_9BILA|nr:Cation transporter family protein [Onchocerca flexuosa]